MNFMGTEPHSNVVLPGTLAARAIMLARRSATTAAYKTLSKREQEVLHVVVYALTNYQIAEQLGISMTPYENTPLAPSREPAHTTAPDSSATHSDSKRGIPRSGNRHDLTAARDSRQLRQDLERT